MKNRYRGLLITHRLHSYVASLLYQSWVDMFNLAPLDNTISSELIDWLAYYFVIGANRFSFYWMIKQKRYSGCHTNCPHYWKTLVTIYRRDTNRKSIVSLKNHAPPSKKSFCCFWLALGSRLLIAVDCFLVISQFISNKYVAISKLSDHRSLI